MTLGSISFSFLMPPMIFIVSALLGVLACWRWRRGGLATALISVLALYAFSTPLASSWLMERAAAPTAAPAGTREAPQAIILVMADAQWSTSPGERDQPGPLSLERIVATARLNRALGLPVLVTGGADRRTGKILAALGTAVLDEDFKVVVRWREERSTNTFENAAFSAPILSRDGISNALIVAQDWDMARAVWSFERAGIVAIPAPAGERSHPVDHLELGDVLPSYRGFQDSFYALHELLGLPYYRWHYGAAPGR
jgi:uncharacterized SAM-binding protein YcdF (DUF218 family)